MNHAAVTKNPLALLAITATAAVLAIPLALGDVRMNDSFWIDWVWLDQFADRLRHGVLYPRWLPQSHGGLGSPVFYYYPPLAFYFGSAFVLAGLSVYSAILATFVVVTLLSGVTMYWWLKDQSQFALLGALLFMVAPYHVFNFYVRGAIAETFATALLPLVMLGLRRMSQNQRGSLIMAAVSYAALIGSHLPLALLASLFLFGPYALLLSRGRLGAVFHFAAVFAAGIVLAAVYLVPAFALERYRDTAELWRNPYLQPQNWTFWNDAPRDPKAYRAILLIVGTLALPSVVLMIVRRSGWAMLGLACAVIAAGAMPLVWSLPLLRAVQFPFRLLPIAEFAVASAIAVAPLRAIPLGLSLFPMLSVTGLIVTAPQSRHSVSVAELERYHPDVPENLPPGKRPYSWPSRWALAVAADHPEPQFANGVTVEPLFYFPAWRVECGGRQVQAFPDPRTQLLSHQGSNCTRSLGWTAPEKIGGAISILGLLALILLSVLGSTLLRVAPAVPKGAAKR